MIQAMAESAFRSGDNGGERNANKLAVGLWQISLDANKHPGVNCQFKSQSEIVGNVGKNIDCLFRFFDLRARNAKPIYGRSSDTFTDSASGARVTGLHWSVLREGHYFEKKFVPPFKHYVPECRTSVHGANVASVNGFNFKSQSLPGLATAADLTKDQPI